MKTYEQMAEDVLSRIDKCRKIKINRRKRSLRAALIVSCFAVLTGVCLWYSGIFEPNVTPALKDSGQGSVSDNLSDDVEDENIIASFSTAKTSSYAVPKPGEYGFNIEVSEARKHYNYNTKMKYLLKLDVFSGDGKTIDDAVYCEEFKRLAEKGYSFYNVTYWDYSGENGEKTEHQVILGLFTEEQLQSFAVNEDYGYMFSFVTNGDYSPVEFEKSKAVVSFDSCKE